MDQRPAPPVTIEGGCGWQLDGPPRDARVAPSDGGAESARPVVALVVGSVLFLLVGGVLSDARSTALEQRETGSSVLQPRVLPAAQEALLDVRDAATDAPGRRALELVSSTGAEVVVEAVGGLPGLDVRLLETDGRPVTLPLRVAAEPRAVVAELTVTSCESLPSSGEGPYRGGSVVSLRLTSPGDGARGTATFGNRYPMLERLRAERC